MNKRWPSAGEEEEERETGGAGDVEALYLQGSEKVTSLDSASSNGTHFKHKKENMSNKNRK